MMYVHVHNIHEIVIETREHPADAQGEGFHVMEISVRDDKGVKVGEFVLYSNKSVEVKRHEEA